MNDGRQAAGLFSPRFLWNYGSEGWPAARLERVLAIGRAFLTVSGLVSIYIDPTEPARLAELTYAVLFGYALYSIIVLVFVHRATRLALRDGEILHGIDILWTAALTFISNGVGSPFFLFFIFVVLAAAYRWGFRGTIVTGSVLVGLVAAGWLIAMLGPWRGLLSIVADHIKRKPMHAGDLLLTAFLGGYLGEKGKAPRAE